MPEGSSDHHDGKKTHRSPALISLGVTAPLVSLPIRQRGKAGRHSLHTWDGTGGRVHQKGGELTPGNGPLKRISIGKRGFNGGYNEDYKNAIFDLIVYSRSLSK
jgi:hypothetical protein